jgi:hypothetical protein
VVYGKSITTLKEQLEKRIRHLAEHPSEWVDVAGVGDKLNADAERMAQHITNYLNAHQFTKVSFERLRQTVNQEYTDEVLLDLIDKSPAKFRRVRMSGGRPGIGFAGN